MPRNWSQALGAYDLACIAALRGREEECREWLAKSRAAGKLPDVDKLRTDSDLATVADKPWFKELITELERDEQSS